MVDFFKKNYSLILLLSAILFFYFPFIFSLLTNFHRLPIPADTIVGLYHPYRDLYADMYPNGIPFKNFIVTDPVRQTYVWKELLVDVYKTVNIPTWNPYEMGGKPLIANFQSGAFYPLNIIFIFLPFDYGWSLFVILQSFLAAFFMYFYLWNLKLNKTAAVFGASAFAFSGFSISWLEWGTILHTVLWLPLLLLTIDKIAYLKKEKIKSSVSKLWLVGFILFLSISFFAGHLQLFFYLFITVLGYILLRFFNLKLGLKFLLNFFFGLLIFLIITFVQWFPTIRFILLSARSSDQSYLTAEGWFLPVQHLIQLFVPDFFGNPTTLNYWGIWNYGELITYVGIVSLIFSFFAFFKKNSTIIFFAGVFIVSLLFALPTIIAKIPFILNIPFISSSQPTRLIFLMTFSLAVLASYGSMYVFEKGKISIKHILPLFVLGLIYIVLWAVTILRLEFLFADPLSALVSQRNLLFPTLIFVVSSILLILIMAIKKRIIKDILIILLILISLMDLIRFAQKYTSFSSKEYLFPDTKAINFLKSKNEIFRVAVTDRRIMAPNFFTHYKIQTIEGYDPLYLKSYAEYIVSLERNSGDIKPPYGFNRIITPHNIESPLFDLLNTKYVMTFDEIKSDKFNKVFEEGATKIYENNNSLPRAFFVKNVVFAKDDINSLFKNDLKTTAVVSEKVKQKEFNDGEVKIISYEETGIKIQTSNIGQGFLVLSDVYYPTWKVFIDGHEEKIYKTNHTFRGVIVPAGNHTIIFKDSLL